MFTDPDAVTLRFGATGTSAAARCCAPQRDEARVGGQRGQHVLVAPVRVDEAQHRNAGPTGACSRPVAPSGTDDRQTGQS